MVPDELVSCPRCGRYLRGFTGTFVNEMRQLSRALLAAPTWIMIIGCLLVSDVLVLLLAWALTIDAGHFILPRYIIVLMMLGSATLPLVTYLVAKNFQKRAQSERLKGRPHRVNISYDE